LSRVSLKVSGQSYLFLLAAPVARGQHIWILRDTAYKPAGEAARGFITGIDESHFLAKAPGTP